MRILVLDDEAAVRQMLRALLEMHGHEITDASNGDDGLHLYSEAPFDLVIMDLNMPKTDTIDVVDQLRQMAKEVNIILCTGTIDIATYKANLAEEYRDIPVLKKPFQLDRLLSVIGDIREFSDSYVRAVKNQFGQDETDLPE